MSHGEFNDLFKGQLVGDFPPPADGAVVELSSDMLLLDAVKLMAGKGISAAPVRDASQSDDASWRDRYCGFLDMVRLTFHIFDILKDVQRQGGGLTGLRRDKRIANATVGELADSAQWTPFIPLTPSNTMLDAMLIIGRFGLHRLPVVNDAGQLSNIVTQSAVVDLLVKSEDRVKSLTSQTLEQLGLATEQHVHALKIDDTLERAIEVLRDHSLSALPVIGVDGAVVGNISARDLRNLIIDSRMFLLLDKPVRNFIAATSEVDHEAMSPAILCRPTTTLSRVMQQLSVSKIHRVYVCNSKNGLLRVLSLSDILALFVTEPPGYLAASFSLS